MSHHNPTTLVVSPEAVVRASSSGGSRRLFGLVRRAEGKVQILSSTRDVELLVPVGTVNPTSPESGARVTVTLGGASYLLELEPGLPEPESVLLLSPVETMDERRRGLVAGEGLGASRVGLFGAGSLGSKVAVLLAEAGVGRLISYDRDFMDTSNLVRHACDGLDLGRAKNVAVAEKCALRGVQASAISADVTQLADDDLDALVMGSDLLVATMDSPQAQFLVNEAAVRNRIPAIFAGAFERACGGEILVVRSGGGPCLFDAVGFRAGLSAGIQLKERRQAYQDADQNRLDAEPGLGADIGYLAAMTAAFALAVLDPTGSRADLLDDAHAFTLAHGGSRPRDAYAELFRAPFDLVHARIVRDEPCPVCGYVSNRGIES